MGGWGGVGGDGWGARSAAVAAGVWVWLTLLDGFQGKVARGRGGGREREGKLTNEKKQRQKLTNNREIENHSLTFFDSDRIQLNFERQKRTF